MMISDLSQMKLATIFRELCVEAILDGLARQGFLKQVRFE